jgi:hypothetical protein
LIRMVYSTADDGIAIVGRSRSALKNKWTASGI